MELLSFRKAYRELERIRSMATHYSVSDWDLTSGWALDSSTYVSSPSSIRFFAGAGATCKRSEVWNLAQGMIITYAKTDGDWGGCPYDFGPTFSFRNQATSGSGLGGDGRAYYGYTLLINARSSAARFWLNGTEIYSVSLAAKPAHINVWNKYRVTWWSDSGGGGLIVRLEYFDGTDWVKMINDFTHSADTYKTSTVNRVSVSDFYCCNTWFDDTEIWGV